MWLETFFRPFRALEGDMKSLQNVGENIESFHRETTKALASFEADSPTGEAVLSLDGIRLVHLITQGYQELHPEQKLQQNIEFIEPWLYGLDIPQADMKKLGMWLQGKLPLGQMPKVTLPKLIAKLWLPNLEWNQQSYHVRNATGDFVGTYVPWSWYAALLRMFLRLSVAYGDAVDTSMCLNAVEYNRSMVDDTKIIPQWSSILLKGLKMSGKKGVACLMMRDSSDARYLLGVIWHARFGFELFGDSDLKHLVQTDKDLFALSAPNPEAWAEEILTKLRQAGKLPAVVTPLDVQLGKVPEQEVPAEVIHPEAPAEANAAPPRVAERRKRLQVDGLAQGTLSWDDMVPEVVGALWTVLNPNPHDVNQAVLGVPVRGVGMQPGQTGASQGEPGAETTPRAYEGVQAAEIPFTAPKLVGVEVKRFEFFQRFAANARGEVCEEHGWHFCFTPLSLDDDPRWCFRVVAVNRVVRLFVSPADQHKWYDVSVRKHDKPQPICYLVPADWATAIEQVWALGQVVGKLGKHLPVDTW